MQTRNPCPYHSERLAEFQKNKTKHSATGAVIPLDTRDRSQVHANKTSLALNPVWQKSFSQQAEHGDSLDYLRYLGMLLS